ncbi:MAG: ribosome-associated translation inhibitor RaiA [Actinomycetaceae bacterium]|nr:ribosome-associated translation inhibitor RaiA [Actinomycetaceae bacterium]MDY6082810.1 ribosome-associated translation inhibitor RaiA [Actinomycetaceae bacterium]
MEIVVKGRNVDISDRFRAHVQEKVDKVEQYAPRAQRVEVVASHENNPSLAQTAERIEITVRDKGPVIRAEAASSDRYSALDLALAKLMERLRRARDRRKDHRRQAGADFVPEDAALFVDSVPDQPKQGEESAQENEPEPSKVPTTPGEAIETQMGDSPVVVRQKLYEAQEMTVMEAVDQMELVGHPFFLFIDSETKQPCAVYLRHGWTYGVIRLDTTVA